jgi:hypothetical protein
MPEPGAARTTYDRPPSLDDGTALARVRSLCLALPGAVERPSHGAPAFFVSGRRAFVMFMDNHHRDGRLALWCAAADGMQAALVESDPDAYFAPPCVGHRGWLGVRLDRGLGEGELAGIVEDAYAAVAATRTGAPRARSAAPPAGRGTRPR